MTNNCVSQIRDIRPVRVKSAHDVPQLGHVCHLMVAQAQRYLRDAR